MVDDARLDGKIIRNLQKDLHFVLLQFPPCLLLQEQNNFVKKKKKIK